MDESETDDYTRWCLQTMREGFGGDASQDAIWCGRVQDAINKVCGLTWDIRFPASISKIDRDELGRQIQECANDVTVKVAYALQNAMLSLAVETTGGAVPPGFPFHGPSAIPDLPKWKAPSSGSPSKS